MPQPIFVALDVETTGFDPQKDDLIEVGVIKFTPQKVLDTFEALINPGQPIPAMVTHITGIKDEFLVSAPSFSEVAPDLLKFIEGIPIVGHNINFDISFLKAKGLPIPNPLYDTLDLASILFPSLPSYSLDTLTRVLNIEHLTKHRALSDSIATQKLFLMLLKEIGNIPQELLLDLQPILAKGHWPLTELFKTKSKKLPQEIKPFTLEKTSATSKKNTATLSDEQRQNFFIKDKTPLTKVLDSFEARETQAKISDLITEHFTAEKHILIEAGTGSGKTLAYLIAAVYFAHQNKQKVVISCSTKNLQDQILNKDIPLLQKALKELDPDLTFDTVQLKGKQNYISLKRLHTFLLKERLENHEITFLLKIVMWLRQTSTGDLDEINLQGREFPLRFEICTQDNENDSYVQQAREKAKNADLIIVNHALLMQECMNENSSLVPEYDHLIIDEAHHLENVATEAATISLSISSMVKPLESFLGKLHMAPKTASMPQTLEYINQLIHKSDIFFGILGIFIQKNSDYSDNNYSELIKPEAFNSLEWQKVKESGLNIIELMTNLNQNLPQLSNELIEEEIFNNEVRSQQRQLQHKIEDFQTIFNADPTQRINWTYRTFEGSGCLKSAPFNVGAQLQQHLFNAKNSVILISSTLTTEQNFTFIKNQLSLDDNIKTVIIPSHFDYPNQVKILIPQDLPAPNSNGYFNACAQIIKETILANKGRTLVLFTAKKALSAMYMHLAANMRLQGYEILAQGMSGGRGKIIEHFKEEADTSAIFGTASFWEGVDLPGELLTCVIMQKLPFDPPTDPIIASRGQHFTDTFNQYQLPLAIIKFKQGFGRLIRTAQDTGSFILLDSRIIHSSYGQKFLRSLPEGITLEYPQADKIAEHLT